MNDIELYVPEHGWELHMSWCPGDDHGPGPCFLEVSVYDEPNDATAMVTLSGTHCVSQRLDVAGFVTTPEGRSALVDVLTEIAPAMADGLMDVDCEYHPDLHPEET